MSHNLMPNEAKVRKLAVELMGIAIDAIIDRGEVDTGDTGIENEEVKIWMQDFSANLDAIASLYESAKSFGNAVKVAEWVIVVSDHRHGGVTHHSGTTFADAAKLVIARYCDDDEVLENLVNIGAGYAEILNAIFEDTGIEWEIL